MRPTRAWKPWVLALTIIALAGVAFDAAQVQRLPTLADTMRPYTGAPAPDRPIQAAFVLQRKDCDGNLRMLDLLHRVNVRSRMSLAVVWYAGPLADSTFVRASLPPWTRGIPLEPLPMHVSVNLARLGHVSTPMLVVLDQHSRIRLATQSPRSPREFAGLAKIVEGLTWIEEL